MAGQSTKRWYSLYFEFNLLYRILIGLVLGIIIGLVAKENLPSWVAPFGTLFVNLLKMIMMPIILSTLIVGASSVSPANLGKVGIRVVVIYLLTSAIAVIIGLAMGAIFHPSADLGALAKDATVAAREAPKISATLLAIVPTSVAQAIVNETILAVIFFALVFGMGVSYLRASSDERLKNAGTAVYNFFDGIAEAMMLVIKGIMQYAPFGVLALVSVVFATNGPKVIGSLGVVTAACFTGYAIHVLLIYSVLLVRVYGGLPLRRFFKEAKDPFITAFVTRSSNGTLPITMEAAENMGVHKDIYSFSLPLGATINMDGTAIYQGVCITFVALTVGRGGFTLSQMGIIVLTATLASIGTAGVPGAGALMLLMVMKQIGLEVSDSIVAGAYAMILGIDALLDMGRTALNVTGDLTCTTIVAKKMKELDMQKW